MGVRVGRYVVLVIVFLFVNSIKGDNSDDYENSYDFIVVGSGCAGSIIASRLSAFYKVLLLEKGNEPNPDLNVPAKVLQHLNNPEYVTAFRTERQSNAGLINNGTLIYLTGSTLGGGSSVNGQIFNQGNSLDYDNWARISNDSSWEYKNIAKVFREILANQSTIHKTKHGLLGLELSRSSYAPGLDTWLSAGAYLGYDIVEPNGPQGVGFAKIDFMRKNGRRVSAYEGFIRPLLNTNSNLTLITNAKVQKILFLNQRATSVTYKKPDGTYAFVKARKEIVLSAGVIGNPTILLRSGVGPKETLASANITCLKDLPVGKNLQDHVILLLHFNVNNNTEVFDPEQDLTKENYNYYLETGDGPFSSFNGIHGQAFLVSSVRKQEPHPNPVWPDIHLHLAQFSTQFGLKAMSEQRTDTSTNKTISTILLLTRPKSKGHIRLDPENPDNPPIINFQYLSHDDDVKAIISGIKMVLQLHEETPPYQAIGASYSTTPLENCRHEEFRSDLYWACYIKHLATPGLHAAGTCRMGKDSNDPNAVVNSELRLLGFDNIRIADTSVIPSITNANTQGPAFAIGEMAARSILNYWRKNMNMKNKHRDEL